MLIINRLLIGIGIALGLVCYIKMFFSQKCDRKLIRF